jgi:hypothetical protein
VAADSKREVEGGRSKSSLLRFFEGVVESPGVTVVRSEECMAGVAHAGGGIEKDGEALGSFEGCCARRRLELRMFCNSLLAGTLLGYLESSVSLDLSMVILGV